MLEVLGIKNAEKLVPVEDDQTPRDPISENMAFLVGKPTKAFIYQDHDAHIATHMAMTQDPSVMQMMGQSPMGQQMMGAVQAHMAQHLAFKYRADVEKQLGADMPAPDSELTEDQEVQLSRLVAQAAQQLSQANQQGAQQQQAQQKAQDPIIQLQQAELQLQQQDLQRKQQKDQADNEIAQQRLALDDKRIQADVEKEKMRVQSDAHKYAMQNHNESQAQALQQAAQQRQHNQKIQADLVKHLTKNQTQPQPMKPGDKNG
jgi:hypothetical protein